MAKMEANSKTNIYFATALIVWMYTFKRAFKMFERSFVICDRMFNLLEALSVDSVQFRKMGPFVRFQKYCDKNYQSQFCDIYYGF